MSARYLHKVLYSYLFDANRSLQVLCTTSNCVGGITYSELRVGHENAPSCCGRYSRPWRARAHRKLPDFNPPAAWARFAPTAAEGATNESAVSAQCVLFIFNSSLMQTHSDFYLFCAILILLPWPLFCGYIVRIVMPCPFNTFKCARGKSMHINILIPTCYRFLW